MAKAKPLLIISLILILGLVSLVFIKADEQNPKLNSFKSIINPTTNFFTQMENESKVMTYLDPSEPLTTIYQNVAYQQIAENDALILYLHPKTLGMAIYDKMAKYLWYSCYPNYDQKTYSADIMNQIASGIIIECFETTSSQLVTTTKYSANQNDAKTTIELTDNEAIIGINFDKVGISFKVKLVLKDNTIITTFIEESLIEVPIKIATYEKKYKLKAITLFPYLGANNYDINAYAMIPDGSGALMRYNDEPYNTAFIKRIYGNDYGIQEKNVLNTHLANQQVITMPIYGVNHGYQQAAFLAEITNGAGSAELHAYPFMYENIDLNRTFFKYLTRDRFLVFMSSESAAISIINENIYPNDFEIKYTFLNQKEASYVGMAKAYQQNFAFQEVNNQQNIPLKLDVIGQDYKPGLFGKRFIKMTSYRDLLAIVQDLLNSDIFNMQISYLGWNKAGYIGNTPIVPKTARKLGTDNDLISLNNYLSENDINIFYYNNPLVVSGNPLTKPVIKRCNLHLFKYDYPSSLGVTGYHQNPNELSDTILKDNKLYERLKITNLNLDYVGNASFSYLYKGKETYRTNMINEIKNQIALLSSFNIGLTNPNDYLYNYIHSYYEAPYESSRYTFFTDSIPFIPLILSGKVELFAPFTNFISDYHLYTLRLVEYNLYPAYLITKEPTHYLRDTNYEYVYTSEYQVWKDEIILRYQQVNDALKHVISAPIVEHRYLALGVAYLKYQNNVEIIINYTPDDFVFESITINPLSYYVRGGNE